MRIAALLVALPAEFVTLTVNAAPVSAEVVAGVVYEAFVAPLIAALFLLHWYDKGAVPDAVTENVAVAPTATDMF